jgi:acyl dehydratase
MPYSYEPHCFEDFSVGQSFESVGRTVTETDVVMHAAMGGDWTEVHTNRAYAETSTFGQRVVHAPLTFQIQMGLLVRCGIFERTVLAYLGIEAMDFPRPLFIDDTIKLTATVANTRELASRNDGGLVALETTVLNQNDEPVMDGIQKFLIRYRDAGSR